MNRNSIRALLLTAALSILTTVLPAVADPACLENSGEAAIKACTAAIGSGKHKGEELASLHFRRGTIHYDLDQYDRALEDFNAAIKHHPESSAAYSGRATVQVDKKNYDQAIADFSTAIKLDATNAFAFENRGDVFVRIGKFKEAASDYESSLKLTPDNPWSMYGRGVAKIKSGNKSGNADLAAATKLSAKVAQEYAEIVGVKP